MEMDSACWVLTTTAVTRRGTSFSYSTVTWAFPSGRRKSSAFVLRTSARRRVSLCASMIGKGISSGVSRQA
jgi:hypothetical protein